MININYRLQAKEVQLAATAQKAVQKAAVTTKAAHHAVAAAT